MSPAATQLLEPSRQQHTGRSRFGQSGSSRQATHRPSMQRYWSFSGSNQPPHSASESQVSDEIFGPTPQPHDPSGTIARTTSATVPTRTANFGTFISERSSNARTNEPELATQDDSTHLARGVCDPVHGCGAPCAICRVSCRASCRARAASHVTTPSESGCDVHVTSAGTSGACSTACAG